MRRLRTRFARSAALVAMWAALAALIVISCQQAPPPIPPVDEIGEGDTIAYDPTRTGEVHSFTLSGPGGDPFTITYEEIDGLAIVQGDMIVGTAEEYATLSEADEITMESTYLTRRLCWTFLGIEIHCENYRWPNALVPYVFANDWDDPSVAGDENATMRTAIRNAMDDIEDVAAVRFVERSGQGDYVRFRDGTGCSATVGHQGGDQNINLNFACRNEWVIAHEILHMLGFNHEQSRHDRGTFVQINWDNIVSDKKHNFEVADYSYDFGSYDYDSLMHYGTHDFCKTNASGSCVGPTITTIPAGTAIGQRSHLSTTDIDALDHIYPGEPPTISIVSPTPGEWFSRRSSNIYFDADVVDPEGMDVDVTWTSNVSGVLATGTPVTVNTGDMEYGMHTITARAVDPQGLEASASVYVTIVNDPPTVDLFFPIAGDFCVNETITFRATVIDLNELGATLPNSSVAWHVAGGSPYPFAYGKTVTHAFGSAGDYQVVVRATDPLDAYDEDWVYLGIDPCTNLPPTVAITTPSSDIDVVYGGFDSGRGQWYADVNLVGTATDPEDGSLTGNSLTWTTNQTDLQSAVLGHGTSLTARLYSNVCEGVTHTITLSATDSNGNTRTAVVRIFIWDLC